MADITYSRNVAGRIIITPPENPATLEIVEVANPVTGAAIEVLDTALAPVVFALSLTQTPGNVQSWFSDELIFEVNGVYIVEFNPGAGLSNFTLTLEVSGVGSLPVAGILTCTIEDTVIDGSGAALENVTASARVLALPAVLASSVAAIGADIIADTTDVNGHFTVTLIQGATVDFHIPAVGWRRTIVVPALTTSPLFSLA